MIPTSCCHLLLNAVADPFQDERNSQHDGGLGHKNVPPLAWDNGGTGVCQGVGGRIGDWGSHGQRQQLLSELKDVGQGKETYLARVVPGAVKGLSQNPFCQDRCVGLR